MAKRALLIGNGINRLIKSNMSWDSLLSDLSMKFSNGESEYDKEKPLPLRYQELLFRSYVANGGELEEHELKLRKEIIAITKKIEKHKICDEILNLEFDHMITTNYDLNLEWKHDFQDTSIISEKKYNIFRKKFSESSDKTLWYCHGVCEAIGSITLGFEHYMKQSAQIIRYIVKGLEYTNKFIEPYHKSGNINSWVDVFLNYELHIIGFGFDYEEKDLWLLLDYWARKKKHQFIKYYYFSCDTNSRAISIREMLRSFGVQLIEISCYDYVDGYNQLCKKLK